MNLDQLTYKCFNFLEDRKWLLFVSTSLVMTFLLWQPLLEAKLYIIDDHEIVASLTPSGTLALADIPGKLMESEVGKPFESLRYRPSLILLRLLETYLWHDNSVAWYLTCMSIYALSFVIACYVLTSFIGWLPALAFSCFEFSRPYWLDVFARLGPSEQFGLLGIALFCLGLYFRFKKQYLHQVPLLLCLGTIVAAGSKENFLFLILPVLWLMWLDWKYLAAMSRIAYLATAAYTFFISTSILVAVAAAAQDFYANSISVSARAQLIWNSLDQSTLALWLLAILVFLLLSFPTRNLMGEKDIAFVEPRRARIASLALGALLLVYLGQHFFYLGIFKPTRYLFPLLFSAHLAALVPFAVFYPEIRSRQREFPTRYALGAILFLSVLFPIILDGARQNRWAAGKAAVVSIDFQKKLDETVALSIANPEARIVFLVNHPLDLEPVISVQRFLRFKGISSAISIVNALSMGTATSPLERRLTSEMLQLERRGGSGFVPWMRLEGGACVSVLFSANVGDIGCISGPRIW